MITVKLLGGLGNQMFQFATGRAVARRLGSELLLDISSFERYDLRRFELEDWAINARVATASELARAGVVPSSPRMLTRISRLLGLALPATTFRESSFAYDPGILQVTDPVYLDGYFQSERYFSDVAGYLREEFVLRQPTDAKNKAMEALIRDAGPLAVSLHIRRGDYVANAQTAQYHGVCSLDYYSAAVAHIAEQVGGGHYFVFSDDLAWVRENLKITQPMTLVDVNGPDKGAWDMALMTACRHHIIANSSFSWWGAWLNPRPDKIIVAPKRWFAGASHDTTDLVPASWIRL
ncbi:MAG: alpha-1,2-fucosyltransferase [Alphaproteobacteria bacterium]|uniref:Putative glycosyltransferase n=1 Tax=viral metagenome TaxID=1070528 RepID=A0A6M3XCC4_9ZZZZ|nr:alpha-1,2-fucosyltransferase [Alphaproteobacteria bacterium]MBU1549468.1 alpha-1,2-fucosyltransferase [Alphaproteobacteria bacterium]MBU2336995.1 alpha-1,2-fucosyltransferase [Alphaproteobacteria bacterium]MBU2391434.1 alpha-1,2-fucosyltransferase [Alphaproteobacteria bacterium]